MTTPTERLIYALCERDVEKIRAELTAGANPNGYRKQLIGGERRVFYWFLASIDHCAYDAHSNGTYTQAKRQEIMDGLQANVTAVAELMLDAGMRFDTSDFSKVDQSRWAQWVRPLVEALVINRGTSGTTKTKKTRKL